MFFFVLIKQRVRFIETQLFYFCSKETKLQRRASQYSMIATMSYTFPAIFSSLILGAWSDTRGRKPAIFLPVLGGSVQTALILATAYFRLPAYVVAIGKQCGDDDADDDDDDDDNFTANDNSEPPTQDFWNG